jgi:glycosyltransferase involved in cell wall biosynthesis
VFSLPLVTTKCIGHGPEIAYLKHGVNGLMTPDDLQQFASAVSSLSSDPAALERMRKACASGAAEFSIEHMASRFLDGTLKALASPGP